MFRTVQYGSFVLVERNAPTPILMRSAFCRATARSGSIPTLTGSVLVDAAPSMRRIR